MPRDDEVVHEDEEEDLGTAMQNIPIPFNELDQLPIDSVHGFPDDVKEIIEDFNLFFEDTQEFDDRNHNKSFDDSKLFGNSMNPPTVTRGRLCVPKPSRNKRGRPPKRQCFKNAASRFDSNFVDITEKSCSHCGTRKTPLWREGPRGASTLCNACGMRYRTGRLLPEYRPASSPDFIPNIHSNFHRKVMEIRRERNLPRTQ